MITLCLSLRSVAKSYGGLSVLKGIDLDVSEGEFLVLVGPSGCGKSTLLRMIAGLEDITDGEIAIKGRVVNNAPPGKRGIAMVFQNYALYPHMTVRDNMGFGLRNDGLPREQVSAKVAAAAESLNLTPLLDRRPGQLSGGQRQRVAIGRAIVREPDVFLFDEPLSNLDAALRAQTRVEIAKLHQRLGNTIVYVTHDQVEAMTLADRIVVLNAGRPEQVGTPQDLYERPHTKFIAGFIGTPQMNFLDGTLRDNRFITLGGSAITLARSYPDCDSVTLGIRPEHLNVWADGPLSGVVEVMEYLGERSLLHVRLSDGTAVIATSSEKRVEGKVQLGISTEHVHLFDSNGRAVNGKIY